MERDTRRGGHCLGLTCDPAQAGPGGIGRSCVYNVRMARVNVYLPDELAEQARAADLNVSGLTQEAIRRALDARAVNDWLDDLASLDPIDVDYGLVKQAVAAAKDEFGL